MKRLFTDLDFTQIGIKLNQYHEFREFISHKQILKFFNKEWIIDYTFEYDHKESKFLSRERSNVLSIGPSNSYWSVKFENTMRKNIIEKYSSRDFIRNESMHSLKQSVALQYAVMNETKYHTFATEFAYPFSLNK